MNPPHSHYDQLRRRLLDIRGEILSLVRRLHDASKSISPEQRSFHIDMLARAVSEDFVEGFFTDKVLAPLDRPQICTSADLVSAFVTQLCKFDVSYAERPDQLEHDFEEHLFGSFLDAVIKSMERRASDPLSINVGRLRILHPDAIDAVTPTPFPLWTSARQSCRVLLLGCLPARGSFMKRDAGEFDAWHLFIRVDARYTERAMRVLEKDMVDILATLFRTFEVLEPTNDNVLLAIDEALLKRIPTDVEVETEFGERIRFFTGLYWIPRCLDAYFSSPTKTDSIDRRIRNAIYLLLEADRQAHDAIGVALAMSAAEALLARKGSDIATSLAENVATLLEPDLALRSQAVEVVKALYDDRSRVLHGDRFEHHRQSREDARLLSSAILRGMLERREFMRRAGYNPERPDDLLLELGRAKFNSGELTGVSASPAGMLWNQEVV